MVDLDPDENDASTVSGGYILRVDDERGDRGDRAIEKKLYTLKKMAFDPCLAHPVIPQFPCTWTKRSEEQYFMYEDPDKDVITEQQKRYIQDYLAQFENALVSDNFEQVSVGTRIYRSGLIRRLSTTK